ncbi:MAG: isoprenylcysteine carboxylmethyltransferase family protein [Candidatus Dormibacteraeota bacterium]|nr:isoprenylcysteine carboxylmethyltransferase family protein [Candidatus Dormibacteraeota bacterium]MBV9524582.1 isoprenylcysteine carboxylmethyltransferase family protein [Candidatus Dormibacteraeota bacterium]
MALPASRPGVRHGSVPAGLSAHLDMLRFLVFGRAVPAVFFGVLGWRVFLNLLSQVHGLPTPVRPLDVMGGPLPVGLYFLFCAIPVAIYLGRPRPRARDGRLIARAAGLTGTVMLLVVGAFPAPVVYHAPAWLRSAGTPVTVAGFILAIWGLLYLRRSLSIIPEARRMVTEGPYRVIRHPLYAAEILVASAILLSEPTLWAALAFVPFIGVQLLRASFEERLLTRAFPGYADYARYTWRIIPFVW